MYHLCVNVYTVYLLYSCRHLVFDDSGNIVRECDVDIPAHQRRLYDNVTRSSNASTLELQHMLPIQATIGKNLYKYDSRLV